MKYSASLDDPLARHVMEQVLRPFQIWSLFGLVMLGSIVFIAGVLLGGAKGFAHIALPDPTLMILLGLADFTLFFPFFACLYYSRILFRAIQDLEREVESLKGNA